MLGNICQQLYTMVDTMVVGQVVGVEALAALGAVDFPVSYTHLDVYKRQHSGLHIW